MITAAHLSRAGVFEGLSSEILVDLAKAMREVSYKSGALIFSVGEQGQSMYVVLEGRVRISVLNAEGRQISFRHIEAGQAFGEIAVFDGGTRSATATALTAVKLASLSKPTFDAIADRHPVLLRASLRFVCDRLRQTSEQLEAIALHPLEVRLSRLLLSMVRKQDDDKSAKRRLESRLSQGELALLIGATRPRVNDALALLEAQGAIERDGATLICNLAALATIGETDD